MAKQPKNNLLLDFTLNFVSSSNRNPRLDSAKQTIEVIQEVLKSKDKTSAEKFLRAAERGSLNRGAIDFGAIAKFLVEIKVEGEEDELQASAIQEFDELKQKAKDKASEIYPTFAADLERERFSPKAGMNGAGWQTKSIQLGQYWLYLRADNKTVSIWTKDDGKSKEFWFGSFSDFSRDFSHTLGIQTSIILA